MIDERDLGDPSKNYTTSENQPLGARMPEYTFRQLVEVALRKAVSEASKPRGFLDELYATLGQKIIDEVKGYYRQHQNIPCVVNWPRDDLSLPYVAIVNMGEREDDAFRFLGDRAGPERAAVSGALVGARQQKAIGISSNVDVIVGSQDPNLTMFLHHFIKYAFFSNKAELSEYFDVHNLIIGARDLAWDQQMLPTFGYYKTVNLSFMTMFDYNLPSLGPLKLEFGLRVEADAGGVPTITEVPGDV